MPSDQGKVFRSPARQGQKKPEEEKQTSIPQRRRRLPDNTRAGGDLLFPTGCSMLNVGLSGKVDGGWGSGRMVNLIGDSHAGKSILALTGLAEMAHDARWDDYLLIYHDNERACAFNMSELFGHKLVERLNAGWEEEKSICGLSGEYYPPRSIQEFYQRALRLIESGRPIILIEDSYDVISPEEELKRAEEIKDKGKTSGSFKTEKARWGSEIFRVLADGLSNTKSLLVIISQTRANLDPMSFQKKTRSGGNALDFYASHIVWLTRLSPYTKGEGTKKVITGRVVQAQITKNKLTGWEGKVSFPIMRQIGIDEVGACVDFCLTWHPSWKKTGNHIVCEDLDLKGYREAVCKNIDENYMDKIKAHLQEAWDEYQAAGIIDRLPRFRE